ncbi:MAG: IS3 family transposase, partial [Fimbriimonadaceae bacterium]
AGPGDRRGEGTVPKKRARAPQPVPGARFLMERGVTARRACHIAGISSAAPYRQPVPERDHALRERLRSVWRPNMGYRMAHAFIRDEFAPLNVKRVHRLWKEEKLGRIRRYRKKRTGSSVPLAAEGRDQVWCLDFCFDSCLNGTKLKVLAIVDEFTRECLALEAATSFKSMRVQQVLAGIFESRGAPEFLRSDNGSEFIARSLAVFLVKSGTQSRFIKPGSPWQNGHAESFVSRLRAELLDVEAFHNLADAQVKLALYRRFYNEERPHSSLGYRPPAKAMSESTKDSS